MIYNPWTQSADWERTDPKLSRLAIHPVAFDHTKRLAAEIVLDPPGIVIVRGPRQVGKSTFLRQFCARAIAQGVRPDHLALLDAEQVGDYHGLQAAIERFLAGAGPGNTILCVDEITSVAKWWKGVKILADRGVLDNTLLLLTGSSADDLDEGADLLPGRRGRRHPVDYILYPLSFRDIAPKMSLDEYFLTGGFPWAINEYLSTGQIPAFVYEIYGAWIDGAFVRRSRSTVHVPALLNYLVSRAGTPVSVTSLSRDCGMGSNHTGEDYLAILERNYALHAFRWLDPRNRVPAPRRNRKLYPADPLLLHLFASAGRGWEFAFQQSRERMSDPQVQGKMAELTVAAHAARLPHMKPLGYFLGKREMDFVGDECIEVKYQYSVSISEFAWVRHVVPPGMRVTVVTRNTLARDGDLRLVPLEQWLHEFDRR